MRRRFKTILLILATAALMLGQGGIPLENPRVRRLGEQLACLCGCGSSVTSCNMLHCHFSDPARQKLLSMVNAGMPDAAIFEAFVKEYGTRVLLKPPAEGFNLLGWVMPFIALAFGFVVVWKFIQYFRRAPAPAGAAPDPAVLARYQERIDRDLENLD
ncbi:MAG TPA: cytochrome c-type biogenesis protein CcmH [Bryobacteraceae bacterium]|nr:cytochrome c-type biogenesis protein CcmH [Bryobacteraceae bacterium]HOQ47124.1 cytochrome c-type biogenesis protein CcmH [Bryobacteraceae bacterium]HPQ16899.1 cytochrome c-type biogenesis protein CcmH [Bryobacteraceae bacterium]HPU72491.1 cytochrome c-type biogenesis protein CcmH [Bryobacteraceae bacterium]